MQQDNNTDYVRARFTVWMTKLALQVRIRFLQKKASEPDTIPIRQVSQLLISVNDLRDSWREDTPTFRFGDLRFEDAFSSLSEEKQRILILYYVEGLKPREIAAELRCSPQRIYDQKYHALKQLQAEYRNRGDRA